MPIRTGLVGPKSENVGFSAVFVGFFEGSKGGGAFQELQKLSEPDRPGGGRGRVNPPPGACLEVLEVWRV